MMKNEKETKKKDPTSASQVSNAKGLANEKKLGGALFGFLNKMLIPIKANHLIFTYQKVFTLPTQRHKRYCEINSLLSFSGYGEISYS